MVIREYEILEAIANAGHTYSPESDGKYILRNHDALDLVKTIAKLLIAHGIVVSAESRVERWRNEHAKML